MKISRKKVILSSLFLLAVIAAYWIYAGTISRPQVPRSHNADADNRTGLKTETLQAGYGQVVTKPGDLIAVNYIGSLQDGTMFDSNLAGGKPFEVFLGKGSAFKGWDEGLMGMKVGEKRKLVVPPQTPGSEGRGNVPKDATLYYEVELVEIK